MQHGVPTEQSGALPQFPPCRQPCLPSLCARRDYLSICAIQDIRHNNAILTFPELFYLQHQLCLHAVILFPLYPIHQRSVLEDTLSYFVQFNCFTWNKLPIDLLKIDNRSSFHHTALNHFCNTFKQLTVIVNFVFSFCVLLCNVVFCLCLRSCFCSWPLSLYSQIWYILKIFKTLPQQQSSDTEQTNVVCYLYEYPDTSQ